LEGQFEGAPSSYYPAIELQIMTSGQLPQEALRTPQAADLDSIPWFSLLHRSAAARVRREMVLRSIGEGAAYAQRGERALYWTGVLDGLMRICHDAPGHLPTALAGLAPGAWFGEGLLLKHAAYHHDVIALRRTRLALVPAASFYWLLDNCPPLNRYVMDQLAERLRQCIAAAEIHLIDNPDVKVARSIGALLDARQHRTPLLLRITQQELGMLVGLSRQRVNQALQGLQEQGLVRIEYSGLRVVEPARLQLADPLGDLGERKVRRRSRRI
jgi:CRP/FNR family cyclic AMP-dependent transcriptional regulator